MTDIQIVILIIIVSTFISILYLTVGFIKKSGEMKISGIIMLLSPPVGVLFYSGQYVALKLIRGDGELDLEDVTFSKKRRNRILNPIVEEEMQTVPLEELFIVASDTEKRKHLLAELKKEDAISDYGIIAKALDNDDVETSHYAAAAITNVKATFENGIRLFDNDYHRKKDDMEFVREYADYVLSFLRSGILAEIETRKYSYLLINILTGTEHPESFLTERDYVNIVDEAIKTGDFSIAEKWAKFAFSLSENESTYLNLLKTFYVTNRREDFFDTLEKLKKSDIPLSHNGLEVVRFFLKAKPHK